MQGKVVVVTGGTSGIGEVAAVELAKKGARIVLVARNPARAESTLQKLRQANPAVQPTVHFGELSLLTDMQRVAADIAKAEARIDVLVNNAGALFNTRRVTADGLEMTFAVNHMGYFVITQGLLHRLKATPGARIVCTSSGAHRGGRVDFADLQSTRGFFGFRVYATSKLENILFTRELARRLQGTGVTVNCLHPGFVASRFADHSGGVMAALTGIGKSLFAISPAQGAKTIVYLASSPDVAAISGEYFYKSKVAPVVAAARNDDGARRLWEESERILAGAQLEKRAA